MSESISCPYCGSFATIQDSHVIYGVSYGPVYICVNYPKCDSYVGVHRGTYKAKGTLADRPLRRARKQAHSFFDTLWKSKLNKLRQDRPNYPKSKVRNNAYAWLAQQLDIPRDQCHIGEFDLKRCNQVIEVCKPFYKNTDGQH